MNEWRLLFSFIVLGLLALPLICYPLRQLKFGFLIAVPSVIIALSLAYWHWGAWSDWQNYLYQEANKQQLEAVLQTIKSPQELINRMKTRLADDPKSTRGWYLLGRLYASQGQWSKAQEAFFKAHQLSPEDDPATLNYAQSLWQLNQQQFNEQISKLYKAVLQKNPNQPDALAMLAMATFKSHDYQQAVNYWQRLLKLAPEQSEEAQMIRKAIAKAEEQLFLKKGLQSYDK